MIDPKRYRARLRPDPIGDGPIDFYELAFDGVGVWDLERKCFVNMVNGEWVPEEDADAKQG